MSYSGRIQNQAGADWARALRAGCPHSEGAGSRWLDGAEGDRTALEKHAAACGSCRAELFLAAEFADPKLLRAGVTNLDVERICRDLRRRRSGSRRWRVWLSAAAAAVLVALTAPLFGPPELGAPPQDQVWRSTAIEWRWAGPGLLEWEAVAEAHHYRIVIRDEAGLTVRVDTTNRTRVEIGTVAAAVEIDALDAAGRLLARGQATVTSEHR